MSDVDLFHAAIVSGTCVPLFRRGPNTCLRRSVGLRYDSAIKEIWHESTNGCGCHGLWPRAL